MVGASTKAYTASRENHGRLDASINVRVSGGWYNVNNCKYDGTRRRAVAQLVGVRLGIEVLLVRDSPPVESLYCIIEQDTFMVRCLELVQPRKTENCPNITGKC